MVDVGGDRGIGKQRAQRAKIQRVRHGGEVRRSRGSFEARKQRARRRKVELRVAIAHAAHGLEAMLFDALRGGQRQLERAQRSEAAVAQIAPGAPRNLCELRVFQGARIAAVEFPQRRECDVPQIQIQAHADGVRGHQVLDFSSLKHGNLSIAGAR